MFEQVGYLLLVDCFGSLVGYFTLNAGEGHSELIQCLLKLREATNNPHVVLRCYRCKPPISEGVQGSALGEGK